MKPGKRIKPGDRIRFGNESDAACDGGRLDATVAGKGEDRRFQRFPHQQGDGGGQALTQAGRGKITTEILPAGQWWDAEAYHQLYLDNNPGGYECPSHFLRKFPPLE